MIRTAVPLTPGRSPAERLLSRAAVRCIDAYQRHLSPLKGYSCAYRVHHQAESCSEYVKRTLRDEGALGAGAKVRARFAACREAHLTLLAIAAAPTQFADPSWLSGAGDGLVHAGTWCIPTPFGCCMFSS